MEWRWQRGAMRTHVSQEAEHRWCTIAGIVPDRLDFLSLFLFFDVTAFRDNGLSSPEIVLSILFLFFNVVYYVFDS